MTAFCLTISHPHYGYGIPSLCKGKNLHSIDTIGSDDPDKNDDARIIGELVTRLKHRCDFVNLFIIAVNGQNPRLDGSLLGMIKIFEEIFGEAFWKQVVVLFTRMPMDGKSKRRRAKNNEQTDDQLAQEYMAEVAKRFSKSQGVGYLFLDACYDPEDPDEQNCFDEAIKDLYAHLERAKNLPTSKVQEVETKALEKEIARREKEKEKAEEKLREMARKQEEAAQRVVELQAQVQAAELNGEKEKAKKLENQLKEERSRQKAENEDLRRKVDQLTEQLAKAGFSMNRVAAGINPLRAVAKGVEAAETVVDAATNAFLKLFS